MPASMQSIAPISNVAKSTSLTRKSIKKHFPLGAIMSKGSSNPITLHSVNDEVFPRLWSLMAEVMVVEGELSRSTKEAVALMVSSKNQCPMCVTAHRLMGTAATRAEKTKDQAKQMQQLALHNAAMDYAEILIEETMHSRNGDQGKDSDVCVLEELNMASAAFTSEDNKDAPALLTAAGKAEVALVVVLYNHLNRIISAVLGEQMSHAMFSVPESAARKMESASVMGVVNKMMAPFLAGGMRVKRKPGITASLFPEGSNCSEFMPEYLKGAELAGEERANAVSRLCAWTSIYETQMAEEGIVSPDIIQIMDDPKTVPPRDLRSHKVAHWATVEMRNTVNALPDKRSRAIANVFLLVSYSPQSVFNSIHWKALTKALGSTTAKTLVIWWSMRFTLRRAKGLRLPKTKQPACDGN